MKKKVDSRIKILIENNVALGKRSMFLVIGDEGRNVVVNFYFLLKSVSARKHEILWCYKKKLNFSVSKYKRWKEMKKKVKRGFFDVNTEKSFDNFLQNASIRFCFFKDTTKVLGTNYSMCVLQDFSSITPNILCRCIETVIGGGIIIFLINKIDDLKNIRELTLEYHKKFTREGSCNVYNNYINRFFLSLNTCKNAMFIDDEMNILPLNDNHLSIKKITHIKQDDKEEEEEKEKEENDEEDDEEDDEEEINKNKHNRMKGRKEQKDKEGRQNQWKRQKKLSETTTVTNDMQTGIKQNAGINKKSNLFWEINKSATLGGYLSSDRKKLKEKLTYLQEVCETNMKQKQQQELFLYSSKFIGKKEHNNYGYGKEEHEKYGNSKEVSFKTGDDNEKTNEICKSVFNENAHLSFLDDRIMNLLKICLSIDQLEILCNMCKILRNDERKTNIKEIILSLLANRGRGKSATLGLLLALSIYFNYGNIIIASGNNNGVDTMFEFFYKGLNILGYDEFQDYEKQFENKELKEIHIFKNKNILKQKVRYVNILEEQIPNCELMIIDEAACIPIDILKNKIKGEITILSTTLNGYEGTGKTFTYKLLKTIKSNFINQFTYEDFKNMQRLYFDKAFIDLTLNSPIRYSCTDDVEKWLNEFLCLNCTEPEPIKGNVCSPDNCHLYFVNKNIFKKYTQKSEILLKKIMTLFISSHYKNTPNDLIMILDSKQHHLFVFINKNVSSKNIEQLEIYGVVHCSLEGSVLGQSNMKKTVTKEELTNMLKNLQDQKNIDEIQEVQEVQTQVKRHVQEKKNGNKNGNVNGNINGNINGNGKETYVRDKKRIKEINDVKKTHTKETDKEKQEEKDEEKDKDKDEEEEEEEEELSLFKDKEMNNEYEGNLIPYIISNYFYHNFYNYTGIRIVRISVHPSMQNMHYGSTLLRRICNYYTLYNENKNNTFYQNEMQKNIAFYNCEGENVYLDKHIDKIDYLGTCFGLTKGLFLFWKKSKYIPVFLKQRKNEVTGEFSILMLKYINPNLKQMFIAFHYDFIRTLCNLLSYSFRHLNSSLAMNLLYNNYLAYLVNENVASNTNGTNKMEKRGTEEKINKYICDKTKGEDDNVSSLYDNVPLNEQTIYYFFHSNDLCRLKKCLYEGRDIHEYLYLLTTIAQLILFNKIKIEMNYLEYTVLYAVAFQKKNSQQLTCEVDLNVIQINVIIRRVVQRVYNFIEDIMRKGIENRVNREIDERRKKQEMKENKNKHVEFPSENYKEELEKNAIQIRKEYKQEKKKLLKEFDISETYKRKFVNMKEPEGTKRIKADHISGQ